MIESILLAEDGCDRATAYHMSSKIIRHRDGVFVTWLDEKYRAVVAQVDLASGKVISATPLHQGNDNHCGAALAMDTAGVLHAVCGAHACGGFIHRHTATPGDVTSWSLPESVGRAATYPSVVATHDGGLMLAHRHTSHQGVWGVQMSRRPAGGSWSWPVPMVNAPASGYTFPTNNLFVDPKGVVHLVVEFYKTYPQNVHPPHSMALSHFYSEDHGATWLHDDGREIKQIPVGMEDSFFIAQQADGNLRPANQVMLADGRLVIGVANMPGGADVYVRQSAGCWEGVDLKAYMDANHAGLRVNSQLRLAVDQAGKLVIITTLAPGDEWAHKDNTIAVYWVDPASLKIERHDVVAKAREGESNWLASIEQGHAGPAKDKLILLFTDGNRGVGCENDAQCHVRMATLS